MNHKLLGNYLEKFNNKQLYFEAKASKLLDSAFYFVRRNVVTFLKGFNQPLYLFLFSGELYLAAVFSKRAHAKIL